MNEHVRRYRMGRRALADSWQSLRAIDWRLLLLLNVLQLVNSATTAPDDRIYRRLVVLLCLMAVLTALGCALGIVWRWELPQVPEVNIPVVMF